MKSQLHFHRDSYHPSKGSYQNEIREIFKQVKINIPLLDAINQVPVYAKVPKRFMHCEKEN